MGETQPPYCPYCGQDAVLHRTSMHVFRRDYGPIWECPSCSARVGCHPGSTVPLGGLANAAARKARSDAHAAFDRLWYAKIGRDGCSKHEARSAAYAWLAKQLGITAQDCHIGQFDRVMCILVVDICQRVRPAVSEARGSASGLRAAAQPQETPDA